MFKQLDRYMKLTGKAFSHVVVESLTEYINKNTRLVQQRLEDIRDPIYDSLDQIHSEFVGRSNRFGSWKECLEAHELLEEPRAIEYSRIRNWMREQ